MIRVDRDHFLAVFSIKSICNRVNLFISFLLVLEEELFALNSINILKVFGTFEESLGIHRIRFGNFSW